MIKQLKKNVEKELLPNIDVYSNSPFNPVIVSNIPENWVLVGKGNYAGVFLHSKFPKYVIKVYGENRPGIEEEIEVYKKIGDHASYSKLYAYGERYLILKNLSGITLYNAINKGLQIPEQVIKDVDEALSYAINQRLNPIDIHGKNIVMDKGRGYIVDISDFLQTKSCRKWKDLRKAYYSFYKPFFSKVQFPIPMWGLDLIRKSYRYYSRYKRLEKWEIRPKNKLNNSETHYKE
ncbi:serine/threonine protein kinase [Bacillus taeanensis]|uniref:Serine/threonine protein kinase n=1 Tax=Bacillus taeanensis TaxID=273032 RepID=A0A366XUF6_9BACI|nr:serine/threonine protein kinase [Bacillus taeanensis]RBW69198.1 serine/threonine protein kinase [Bacillus taeanensis]